MKLMRLITWNVNSLRARLPRVLALLERHQPDVVCLQETKVTDDLFPRAELEAAGYQSLAHGQRTYNGVAILSKVAPRESGRGLDDDSDDEQARLVWARFEGLTAISAYVPNGSEVGSEKWEYKLSWLARARSLLDRRFDRGEPLALCGDLNVAPEARDVHDPDRWAESVLFHSAARDALAQVRAWGLVDAFRLHHEEGGLFSWWDYRMLAFPKNHGLRIDHVLVTEPLAKRSRDAFIDRQERKGKQASDHAPVVVDFEG